MDGHAVMQVDLQQGGWMHSEALSLCTYIHCRCVPATASTTRVCICHHPMPAFAVAAHLRSLHRRMPGVCHHLRLHATSMGTCTLRDAGPNTRCAPPGMCSCRPRTCGVAISAHVGLLSPRMCGRRPRMSVFAIPHVCICCPRLCVCHPRVPACVHLPLPRACVCHSVGICVCSCHVCVFAVAMCARLPLPCG